MTSNGHFYLTIHANNAKLKNRGESENESKGNLGKIKKGFNDC